MRHVVRDPVTNEVVAWYEPQPGGKVNFWERDAPPYLVHSREDEKTLVGAALAEHRRQGRIISEEK
jgi:hypothetical protein